MKLWTRCIQQQVITNGGRATHAVVEETVEDTVDSHVPHQQVEIIRAPIFEQKDMLQHQSGMQMVDAPVPMTRGGQVHVPVAPQQERSHQVHDGLDDSLREGSEYIAPLEAPHPLVDSCKLSMGRFDLFTRCARRLSITHVAFVGWKSMCQDCDDSVPAVGVSTGVDEQLHAAEPDCTCDVEGDLEFSVGDYVLPQSPVDESLLEGADVSMMLDDDWPTLGEARQIWLQEE